ncbi:MAG: prepilin-type N-terminal cleavage/methylation domain-containing protein [Pseudomonadota bacterium]
MRKAPPRASKAQQGFTLLEVLISLFLIALIFAVVVVNVPTPREKLEDTLEVLERAIRFCNDESAIRNTVVRLHLYLDKKPQEYSVEYGPNDSFIIPANKYEEQATLSMAEEEKMKAGQQKINRQFNKVAEFKDQNREIQEEVRILALGTTLSDKLQQGPEAAIYFYPSGIRNIS